MIYKYDKEKLLFIKDKKKISLFFGLVVSLLFSLVVIISLLISNSGMKNIITSKNEFIDSLNTSHQHQTDLLNSQISAYKNSLLITTDMEFSEEKMAQMLLDLNVKFPDIVLAQARYESGRFTSQIWIDNNNPFGMKVANSRPTTNIGEKHGHAEFRNWVDAVLDYVLWQASYARKFKTREEYFGYLKKVYAEGPYSSIYTMTKEVQTDYPQLNVKSWPLLEKGGEEIDDSYTGDYYSGISL